MSSRTRPPWWPRAVGAAGAVVFWVVIFGLLGTEVPVTDSILIGVLLVGLPTLAVVQLPFVREAAPDRLPAYWSSMAALWVIGTASWLVGTGRGGPNELGLARMATGPLGAWSAGLLLAGLAVMLVFRQVAALSGAQESQALRDLLPRSAREKRVFALLSLSAGVAEELAYRGYLVLELAPVLGLGGAAGVSSVAFGAAHAYQGALGTLRTTIMGGLLAAGFLVSGSLWPAIVAHVLIDLIAGILLGERLLPPRRAGGVRESSDPSPTEP